MKRLLGGVLDPQASWLFLRGIKTLHVRTERICASALAIAEMLQNARAVRSVTYPLLRSHPDFEVASRQMSAGGGVVSFSLEGGATAARRLLDSLKLIQIASSLGGVETVIEMPYDLDWIDVEDSSGGAADRGGSIRLSVGLEDLDELRKDLTEALNAL
jgi:cystathionine beta-lyase/cystathionine gamma-synthase